MISEIVKRIDYLEGLEKKTGTCNDRKIIIKQLKFLMVKIRDEVNNIPEKYFYEV